MVGDSNLSGKWITNVAWRMLGCGCRDSSTGTGIESSARRSFHHTASEGQRDREKEEKPRTAWERLDPRRTSCKFHSRCVVWQDLPVEGDDTRPITLGEIPGRAIWCPSRKWVTKEACERAPGAGEHEQRRLTLGLRCSFSNTGGKVQDSESREGDGIGVDDPTYHVPGKRPGGSTGEHSESYPRRDSMRTHQGRPDLDGCSKEPRNV